MCGRARRRTVGGTVGRMRDELGQTGGELLGVLLIVSLVIGALSSSGAAATVADETSRLVCAIGGGEDCGGAPDPEPEAEPTPGPGGGDTDEGGEPPQGLPIGDQDVPVLPFPGSVTVHCTFVDGQSRPCGGSDASVSVQADASTTVRRSATTTNAEGCPLTRLSVSTTLELSASGTAEGAHASGTLEGHLGESTTYQITVSPDAADAIADGDRDAPNPVDPTTIADGESVLLSEEYYAGLGLSGSYRALQASLGYDRGTRVSSGVQRVNPTTVRVLVGDEDFVRQTLSLGVGIDGASVSIGSSEQLERGPAARDRHRHLDLGGVERVPGLPRHRHAARGRGDGDDQRDVVRGPELLRRDERGGGARADQRRRPARLVRGPADRDHGRGRERHDRRDLALQQRRPRDRAPSRRRRGPDRRGRVRAQPDRGRPLAARDAAVRGRRAGRPARRRHGPRRLRRGGPRGPAAARAGGPRRSGRRERRRSQRRGHRGLARGQRRGRRVRRRGVRLRALAHGPGGRADAGRHPRRAVLRRRRPAIS